MDIEVDRIAAGKAAVAARQARAELKRKLREGEISPLRVLRLADLPDNAASGLRVTDFLRTFPGIGKLKTEVILQDLQVSPNKRLGGLGKKQRERFERWVKERTGIRHDAPTVTVLAGPTAVGKGTVVKYLLEQHKDVHLSISATTRAPRPGEINGVHYYFVSDEEFDTMLAQNELLEWATVHGIHRYGTPKTPLIKAAAEGKLILLEIDLQGARQVRASTPGATLVFLSPPSWDALVERLVGRGTESAEDQQRRLTTAKVEIAASNEFDCVVTNSVVSVAAEELYEIMRGNMQRVRREGLK